MLVCVDVTKLFFMSIKQCIFFNFPTFFSLLIPLEETKGSLCVDVNDRHNIKDNVFVLFFLSKGRAVQR